jgi:hypothetical protein
VIKGEPGAFGSSPEVAAALAALPAGYLGAFFLSVPQFISNIAPQIPGAADMIPAAAGATKGGMAFGWSMEGERLRFDIVVPISHILELKTLWLETSSGAKRPTK